MGVAALVGTLIAALAALVGVIYTARQQSAALKDKQQDAVDRAVREAVEPLARDLVDLTNERDYLRGRRDLLEDELRRRK